MIQHIRLNDDMRMCGSSHCRTQHFGSNPKHLALPRLNRLIHRLETVAQRPARSPKDGAGARRFPRRTVSYAASLRFDLVDHVLVIVHADMPPLDEDWRRMAVFRDANRDRIRGNLVIAPPRASISASQRADVASFMRGQVSIAVVTDSALIRGIARAVGFLGVQVRAFSPRELESALNYLLVAASKHQEIIRRIDGLKAQLAAHAALQHT